MKVYRTALYVLFFMLLCPALYAQEKDDAQQLIAEGMQLNNQKKYTEAIEKYRSALTIDSTNMQANYQLAFTLFASGQSAGAVQYIERAIKYSVNFKFTAAAYSLSGSIYGSINQPNKAIEAYKKGIVADSANQRIYYNLGIAYFKNKHYDYALLSFADAVKKDVNDAGSTRMYALTAFHQNRRMEAIFGFCRFLILQPNSAQSVEAFSNLQSILQGGQLKPEPGYKPPSAMLSEANRQNLLLKKALTPLVIKKYAFSADLLVSQLNAIFAAKKTSVEQDLFSGYFNQLYQTDNMPAFARYISQTAKPESADWLKHNPEKAKALDIWIVANQPEF